MIQDNIRYLKQLVDMQNMKLPKKNFRFKIYTYFALKFFVWSSRLSAKADILAVSGGDPAKLKEKVQKIMKVPSLSERLLTYQKPTLDDAIANLKESAKRGEMRGNTYEEGRKLGGGLIPAKPGYFQMTDDVSQEKKKELEKLQLKIGVAQQNFSKSVAITPENNQDKVSAARKFYYKRKRQKFNKNRNKGNIQN